jgi:hypothetical protein
MRSQLLICAPSRETGRCSAYFCQNKSLSLVLKPQFRNSTTILRGIEC